LREDANSHRKRPWFPRCSRDIWHALGTLASSDQAADSNGRATLE